MFVLRLASGTLRLDHPIVMGIVNVTPDSFSDGGRFRDPAEAIEYGLALVAQGAAIIDVGGESTRPGAIPVDPDEELRRVLPVIEGLAEQRIVVSVDTRHALVAEQSIDNGASIINDVSGLRDPMMRSIAARHSVPVVIMHMPIDDPATMQQHARYGDVVADVAAALRRQVAIAQASGVEQIIVDPGIGLWLVSPGSASSRRSPATRSPQGASEARSLPTWRQSAGVHTSSASTTSPSTCTRCECGAPSTDDNHPRDRPVAPRRRESPRNRRRRTAVAVRRARTRKP
jgi:dihydropteroate synthase